MMRTSLYVLVSTVTLCAQLTLEESLVGYWPLDGDLLDASGNNHNGVYEQNTKYDVERLPLTYVDDATGGQAVDFRGDGYKQMAYIATGLSFPDDSPKTYSVFVKTTDFDRELVWVGNGAPDGDPGSDGNRCYIGVQEQTVFVGAGTLVYRRHERWPIQDGAWHHYALRINEERKFDTFQDGVKVVSNAGYWGSTATDPSTGTYGTPRSFVIGMGGGRANHPANAIIDDVAVFGRALADGEIASIAVAGSLAETLGTTGASLRREALRVVPGDATAAVRTFSLAGRLVKIMRRPGCSLARLSVTGLLETSQGSAPGVTLMSIDR